MANRYWVPGANATWNATAGTKWAATSNTAGGASVPTAADDVFFDGVGLGAFNCTLATGSRPCRSINFTGYTNTFNHTVGTLDIGDGTAGAGSIAIKTVAGMTYTRGGAVNLISTNGTLQTITWSNTTSPQTLTINGAGSDYELGAALTVNGALTVTQGTFSTSSSNYAVTSAGFSSTGTLSRTISLNSSTYSVATGTWTITGSNVTLNSGTSAISFPVPLPTSSFSGGGLVYNQVTFSSIGAFGANTISIVGSNTIGTLTFASAVNSGVTVQFAAGSTTTITNAINFNGVSTDTILVVSGNPGTQYTISKNGALVEATWIELTDCIGTGEAKYFASNSVNNGNNVNWRFNAPNRGTQSLLGCGI